MPSPVKTRRESDLAAPVRDFLEAQGWTVRSEVNGCDITAVRGEELVVVELKTGFSTDLLIQATQRQRVADTVYVALPAEGTLHSKARYDKRRRGIEHLLKRLEIGLLLVHFPDDADAPPSVEAALHPVREPKPKRATQKRKAILREVAARSADYNLGGVTKTRIATAYREESVFIACLLERHGPMSPAEARAKGAGVRAQNILFKNVYDWFERLERGVYSVRPRAIEEIDLDWPMIADYHRRRLCETPPGPPPTP